MGFAKDKANREEGALNSRARGVTSLANTIPFISFFIGNLVKIFKLAELMFYKKGFGTAILVLSVLLLQSVFRTGHIEKSS